MSIRMAGVECKSVCSFNIHYRAYPHNVKSMFQVGLHTEAAFGRTVLLCVGIKRLRLRALELILIRKGLAVKLRQVRLKLK